MKKTHKNKYFQGYKKLKNIKMFEEMTNEGAEAVTEFSELMLSLHETLAKLSINNHVRGEKVLGDAVDAIAEKLDALDKANKEILGIDEKFDLADDQEDPEYWKIALKNGKTLVVDVESGSGMAGESMEMVYLKVDDKVVQFKDVESQIEDPEQAKELSNYLDDVAAGNDASARSFTESMTNESKKYPPEKDHLNHLLKHFSNQKFSWQIDSDRRSTNKFWNKFGDIKNPATREKFLSLPEIKRAIENLDTLVKKYNLNYKLNKQLFIESDLNDDEKLFGGIFWSLKFEVLGNPENIISFLATKKFEEITPWWNFREYDAFDRKQMLNKLRTTK